MGHMCYLRVLLSVAICLFLLQPAVYPVFAHPDPSFPADMAPIPPPDTICLGDTVGLLANYPLATSFSWSPNYHISDTTIPDPLVWPDTTTSYTVLVSGISANMIVNGDFSQGNVGFTSVYTYTTNLWPEGTYYIGTNPNTYHSNFAICGDHTTGTGNMMIINGSGTPNAIVWQQTLPVVPNTTYRFSCWLASVHSSSPAQLQFFVNGVQIGPVFQATATTCNWNMFYDTWYSGTSTNATISIRNQNTSLSGNDFAIDDVYFAQVIELYDTTTVVVEMPSIYLGQDTAICPGDSISLGVIGTYAQYQWSTGQTTPTIRVHAPGSYWLRAVTSHGCEAYDTLLVSLRGFPPVFMVGDTVCPGDTATLQAIAPGNSLFFWNTGDSGASIQAGPPFLMVYQVIITDSAGCRDTFAIWPTVYPAPVILVTGDSLLCRGETTTLTATGGTAYNWQPGGQTSSSITIKPSQPAQYVVSATDINGCEGSAAIGVQVHDPPEIVLWQEKEVVCIGEATALEAGGGDRYLWSTGDTTGWISIKPTQSTQYWVTVTREYGSLACAADTSIWQEAQSCNTFYIPSAIRLSGTNNLFSPVGVLSEIESYHMRIYNRWGQLLFETYDFSEAWNGKFNGENVPEDVYVYEVVIKAGLDLPQRRRGIITVLK